MKNRKSIYILCIIIAFIVSLSLTSSAKTIINDAYLPFDVYTGDDSAVSVSIGDDALTKDITLGEFQKLLYKSEDVAEDNYSVSTENGVTTITLNNNYIKGLKDGVYSMDAEFEKAIVPLKLFVVTEKKSLPDGTAFKFEHVAPGGNFNAVITDENISFYSTLFKSLKCGEKEVAKDNYSISGFGTAVTVTLNPEYVMQLVPGEYEFTAEFMNADAKLTLTVPNTGDLNCDGNVTSADARLALRASAKLETLTAIQAKVADVNGKDGVTSADARLILRVAAKLETFGNLKEVAIPENRTIETSSSRAPFDLNAAMTGKNSEGFTFNTCSFRGKITDMREFELSWTDEKGEEWGPFSRSILEVEVIGRSPVQTETVRVLYARSLSSLEKDSVKIEKGGEYVFVNCWLIDARYNDYNKEHNEIQYKYDTSTQYADVIMGGAWCSLFPVENDVVYAYHGYFDGNAEAQKIAVENAPATDKLTSADAVASGDYIALDNTKFDDMFSNFKAGFIADE